MEADWVTWHVLRYVLTSRKQGKTAEVIGKGHTCSNLVSAGDGRNRGPLARRHADAETIWVRSSNKDWICSSCHETRKKGNGHYQCVSHPKFKLCHECVADCKPFEQQKTRCDCGCEMFPDYGSDDYTAKNSPKTVDKLNEKWACSRCELTKEELDHLNGPWNRAVTSYLCSNSECKKHICSLCTEFATKRVADSVQAQV